MDYPNLSDVIDFAFDSNSNDKPKPVLVYAYHHNRRLTLFSSEIISEFLNKNYVIYPYDITSELNRNLLRNMWKEMFFNESSIDFSTNQCPIVIGIDRQISMKNSSSIFEYQSNLLYTADNHDFNPNIDIDILINRLIIFKENFDKIEQYFKSKFVQNIIGCTELAISLSEYLSLNDAVTLFSPGILPVLSYYKIPLSVVVYPTKEFIVNMIHQIEPNRIVYLRLKAEQCKEIFNLLTLQTFPCVQTMIIENFQRRSQISAMRGRFPSLTYLSLYCNQSIDFHRLCQIHTLLPSTTKLFQITSPSILCSHKRIRHLDHIPTVPDTNIQIFRINLTQSRIINKCAQCIDHCQLNTLIDFIRILKNLYEIELILHQDDLEKFINKIEWIILASQCTKPIQITIKIRELTNMNSQIQTKIDELQNHLANIKFRFLY